MSSGSKLWAVTLVMLGLGLGMSVFRPPSSTAQQGFGPPPFVKYTVVETEGTNLLVVDNTSNTMYYYTVDPDKTVGDELKLRGSVDLTQVGKPSIKPTKAKQ